MAAGEVERHGYAIGLNHTVYHLLHDLAGAVRTLALGKTPHHKTFDATQCAVETQIIEHSFDFIYGFAYIFNEKYLAPGEQIERCANQAAQHSHISACKHAAGAAFNIERVCRHGVMH